MPSCAGNGVPVARTLESVADDGDILEGIALRGGCPPCFRRRTSHARRTRGLHSADEREEDSSTSRKPRAARLVFVPAPSPVLTLRLVGRTPKTVTFAWKPQPGADGYRFVRNGKIVSQTFVRSLSRVTFWGGFPLCGRGASFCAGRRAVPLRSAKVFVTSRVGRAHATGARSRLVFVPARKIDFRLRLVGRTSRALTFGWKRQPTVDGYRFIRNGKVVSQTFDRTVTRVTFSKGASYVVEALRQTPGKRSTVMMRALAYMASSLPSKTAKQEGAPKSAPPATTAPPSKQPGSSTSAPPSAGATPPNGSTPPKGLTPPGGSTPPQGSTPSPAKPSTGCSPASPNVPGGPDGMGGCWPGAPNTGPDAPESSMSAYSGPCKITAANTTIDSKVIRCDITVAASGLVIKNSYVHGSVLQEDGSPSFTVQDSLINGASPYACINCGVGNRNFTVLRTEIVGTNRGAYCEHSCLIQDSWIHGTNLEPVPSNQAHASAVRVEQHTTLKHNALSCDYTGPFPNDEIGCSADMSGYADFAPIHDNTIDGNLFMANNAGTGFCAYGAGTSGKPYSGDSSNATNIVFRNNVFQRGANGKCGTYGPITDFIVGRSGNAWSNNTWDNGGTVNPG